MSDRSERPLLPDAPEANSSAVPSLLLVMVGAVAVLFVAILLVVAADSLAASVVAVVIVGGALLGVIFYVYRLLARSGVSGSPVPERTATPVTVGAGIADEKTEAALATALRDAHAVQRGTRHFAHEAIARLRTESPTTEQAQLTELLEAQRDLAERHAPALERRLDALGHSPSRVADDEGVVAAWIYERLLAHGALTNARHAAGLARLGLASFELVERLAATSDPESAKLAADCHRPLEEVLDRWAASDGLVLDADAHITGRDATATVIALLDDAYDMEGLHASLLAVAAAQARETGIAVGAEEAGLARLVTLIDQERATTQSARHLLRERLDHLGHHPARVHAAETFAALRTTAMGEHLRGYKLARDMRDLLAADELATTTYRLLERAAQRAHDDTTAELAKRVHAGEHITDRQLASELGAALQITLLAE